MSPNNEMSSELMLEARLVNNLNNKNSNPSFGNRKSMNDLNSKSRLFVIQIDREQSAPVTIISKVRKPDISSKLVIIQKYMRGYKAHLQTAGLRSRAHSNDNKVNSKDTSSSNTLDRATNQLDVLKFMQIHKEETKEDLLTEFNSHREKNQKNKIEMITVKKAELAIDRKPEI